MPGNLLKSLPRVAQIIANNSSSQASLALCRMSSSDVSAKPSKLKVEHDTDSLEFYIKLAG